MGASEAGGGPPEGAAVALVDRRGIVAGWSRAAGELVGRPADEVLGRSVLRLLAEERRARLPERGEAVLRCGGAGSVRVRYRVEELRGSPFSLVVAVGAAGPPRPRTPTPSSGRCSPRTAWASCCGTPVSPSCGAMCCPGSSAGRPSRWAAC
ncbi:PAS domain-containing protein [Actinomadura keratinilytica]